MTKVKRGAASFRSVPLHVPRTAAVIAVKMAPMHRIFTLLAILLAAVAGVRAGTVHGVALEQASGRPLARTVVRLDPVTKSGVGKLPSITIRAGRSGQFVFPAVAEGIYLLIATRDGYLPVAYGQRLPIGRGTAIQVNADSQLFAELRLRYKGALTGRILDENGVATAGVSVLAYRPYLPLRSAGSAISDDRGVYRIHGLDTGKYWVRSAGHILDDDTGWLPTFGSQARESRDARLHPVTVDADTTDADKQHQQAAGQPAGLARQNRTRCRLPPGAES
jgi:hypothetical protein